jgi:5'-phosphate synthase pdxT subunit
MSLNLGVLSIQGDVNENILSIKAAIDALDIDGTVTSVRTPDEISKVDGLVIPGGESTTIGQLSLFNGALKILKEKIEQGMPVLGICAGMILLSKTVKDKVVGKIDQPLLNILDIKLERNSFGRQRESFESDISLNSIGIPTFNGVFIRAPSISDVGSDVEILSKFNGKIIAVKMNNVIGVAFHPELTSDISLHKYFVNLTNTLKN